MPPGEADDAELERPLRHELDDPVRVGDRQRDADVGVGAGELAEQDRDDRAAGPGRGSELEAAGQRLLFGHLVEQLLLGREHAVRVPVQPLPRFGRLDAAARAVEEPNAEPLLERRDLEADRRLRHAQALGRLREALLVDDGHESRELPRIHKRSLWRRAAGARSSIGPWTSRRAFRLLHRPLRAADERNGQAPRRSRVARPRRRLRAPLRRARAAGGARHRRGVRRNERLSRPLPRRADRPRRARLHDQQVPDARARRRVAPRPVPRRGARAADRAGVHARRPLAEGVAARRAAAALERPARRHVVRRPAPDPPALLRAARRASCPRTGSGSSSGPG